ncbi:hypothetical protein CSB09_03410 [Candidatus Gracilibacteria bacterium]|nr:MAG: hypothetical protein CSB09_03410 [Candidatus Gracilibacteria bacterium]
MKFDSWDLTTTNNLLQYSPYFMRPNISNCHALPGTLIIFEGSDGSGKSTQIQALKKSLEKEGKLVKVSSWKSAPVLSSFMHQNESLTKFQARILPETSLFMQAADLLYRIEREIIPALKQGKIVLMDRGIQTLLVRGLMIGMTDTQIRHGLLWWRNTIYKELFDMAHTVYFTISPEESLRRLQIRSTQEQKEILGHKFKKTKLDGTLLALHFINSLVYASDGKKMTRNDKKVFIENIQKKIIDTYTRVFQDETLPYTEIDALQTKKSILNSLRRQVIDALL